MILSSQLGWHSSSVRIGVVLIAYLEAQDGRRIEVPTEGRLVIGRVAACDVQIDDPKASRRHAQLIAERGVYEVEDLGSSNGTLLNGNPVHKRVIRAGDVIQIGATRFTFREGAAAAPDAAAVPRGEASALGEDELFGDVDLLAADPRPPAPPRRDVPRVEPPRVEAPREEVRPVKAPDRVEPRRVDISDPSQAPRVESPPRAESPPRPVTPPPPPRSEVDTLADELADELRDDAFDDLPIAPPQNPQREPQRAKVATPPDRAPAPRLDPDELVVARRAAPAAPPPSPSSARATPQAATDRAAAGRSAHGVLQFAKQRSGGGPLTDDVSQTGGLSKFWIVLAALAFAAAVGYGAMVLGRG